MKLTATLLLGVISLYQSIAQTTIHGIDPNWYQNPKAAVTSATYNLKGAEANCVVVKSDGTVVIFYKQGGQNKWIQSSDGGNTWTSPGSLPGSAANGLSTITADIDQDDNIYIAWKSGDFSLGFAKYNGTSWVNTYTLNTQTQTASDTVQFSQITVDRLNRIHLMWQQGNHKNYSPGIKSTCWYARSTDGGISFTSTLLSQGNTYHAAFPVADFGGTSHDTLLIAWRENVNGYNNPIPNPVAGYPNGWNWDVKARITYDGGATWNNVITIAGSGANDSDDDQWDPNAVVDKNGVIHVFYHIYHNNVYPDYNANIIYKYSLDGGNTWLGPLQLSTDNVRSHLIKTAYDYTNNYVWCTWKDEIDFGNIPNNPQADLKAVYIKNTGTPIISAQEYLTDHLSEEVAFHNFKVGNDGIMRATYNISKLSGKGDTIFYTQRNSLNTTGIDDYNNFNSMINIYPNPTNGDVIINKLTNNNVSINIYNPLGQLVFTSSNFIEKLNISTAGVYYIIATDGRHRQVIKLVRQ
ncbi:MAG: T9SS type A sorting domain-containing protein [Bacteroidales bacterium]|nr:T9SS type A sorting domain-containing protein [Bacteroidales bacterium]